MTVSAFGLRRSSLPVQSDGAVPRDAITTELVAQRRAGSLPATASTIFAALLLGFAAYVGGLSAVVHARTQQLAYAQLRAQLANGTAPLDQFDATRKPLALGAPVALLEARGIREVVREGTTSGVLTGGPGHRRDTPLPGQPGTSVVYGRKAAFGGPFAAVSRLRTGDRITVTTGQGRHEYRVTGLRHAGDPLPPPVASRLTLVTADGPSFLPAGAVRVDAELIGSPVPGRPMLPVALADAERPLAADRGALVPLVLLLQGLILVSCLAVWMAARWGRRQAWLVGVPAVLTLGTGVAAFAAQLLPNLT